jgi:response regulator RpfG family c-di-GMP phosphodiesterase
MSTTAGTAQKQMESLGFASSEERTFFKKGPRSPALPVAISIVAEAPAGGPPPIPQMDSKGFGDSLDERIFFTAPPSSRDPAQVARLTARKLGAGLLRAFVAGGQEDEAHCERVAAWSRRLGREMGLTAERILDLELGALLHDVGYIKLRNVDFHRKGPLTAGELFELRRHPELGVALLQTIPGLRRAAAVVASHHERFDGGGYPRGLQGEEIPLAARIFALVDAYDSMTGDRPYHARISDAEARTEIKRHVGTQFDPAVYAAFERIDASEWIDLARALR